MRLDSIVIYGGIRGITHNSSIISSGATLSSTSVDCHKLSGSISNLCAMMLARHNKNPDIKQSGIFNLKPLVAFTSDQSHYSIKKGGSILGLGMDNVVLVQTDSWGRMLPRALKEAVKEARRKGGDPFFVNATGGSTVLGSCDPLGDIADVCQEEELWLHVDSRYLYQQDKFYDDNYDLGDKSIQCGRKPDALKLYLALCVYGLDQMEQRVDDAFKAARYLQERIVTRPGFRPVISDEVFCVNTCFWYIPPSLRGQPETQEWWEKLSKVAPKIFERMMTKGTLVVVYQPIVNKTLVNFFRVTPTTVPTPTFKDIDYILDETEKLGCHDRCLADNAVLLIACSISEVPVLSDGQAVLHIASIRLLRKPEGNVSLHMCSRQPLPRSFRVFIRGTNP
ncbi:Acidic amino acid decarboxylase GADL1-like 1, partial [Homarus americanus]